MRSRRDRCKNGVQFTQTLHPDFRKSERFEVKKSLSDIAMKGKHFGISSKNFNAENINYPIIFQFQVKIQPPQEML